jgi:pilus assembly protein Flp/PilA
VQKSFKRFIMDDSGDTAIEYGLMAALLAVGILVADQTLGSQISTTFNSVSNGLTGSQARNASMQQPTAPWLTAPSVPPGGELPAVNDNQAQR